MPDKVELVRKSFEAMRAWDVDALLRRRRGELRRPGAREWRREHPPCARVIRVRAGRIVSHITCARGGQPGW